MKLPSRLATGVVVAGALVALASPALAASATIGDNFYSPKTISVQAGQSVTWVYASGNSMHSVSALNGSFDSSPTCPADPSSCLHPGQSYTHTFSTPGTFAYDCHVHGAAMSGTVIVTTAVTPPPSGAGSGGNGGGGTTTGGGTTAGGTTAGVGTTVPLPNTGSSAATLPFAAIGLGCVLLGGAASLALRRRTV